MRPPEPELELLSLKNKSVFVSTEFSNSEFELSKEDADKGTASKGKADGLLRPSARLVSSLAFYNKSLGLGPPNLFPSFEEGHIKSESACDQPTPKRTGRNLIKPRKTIMTETTLLSRRRAQVLSRILRRWTIEICLLLCRSNRRCVHNRNRDCCL